MKLSHGIADRGIQFLGLIGLEVFIGKVNQAVKSMRFVGTVLHDQGTKFGQDVRGAGKALEDQRFSRSSATAK